MNDKNRNLIIVVILIALAIYIVANPRDVGGAFASVQGIAALLFYSLGAWWFYNHRK